MCIVFLHYRSCTVPRLNVSDAEQGSDLRPSIDLNYQKFQRTNNNTVMLSWIYNNTPSCPDAEITMEAYTYSEAEVIMIAASGNSLIASNHFEPNRDGFFIIENRENDLYYKIFAGRDGSCSLSSPYLYNFILNGGCD